MTKENLIKITQSFLCRVRMAESDRAVYQQYCDYGKKYKAGIDITPAFWTITARALVHNMMMELSKLYDERTDVYGAKKLISSCDNVDFFADKKALINELNDYYDKESVDIENLRKQRNKIWAHSDTKAFIAPESIENQYSLSWTAVENLIKTAGSIGNCILVALGETAECLNYSNTDDILLIFETMQKRAEDEVNGQA